MGRADGGLLRARRDHEREPLQVAAAIRGGWHGEAGVVLMLDVGTWLIPMADTLVCSKGLKC